MLFLVIFRQKTCVQLLCASMKMFQKSFFWLLKKYNFCFFLLHMLRNKKKSLSVERKCNWSTTFRRRRKKRGEIARLWSNNTALLIKNLIVWRTRFLNKTFKKKLLKVRFVWTFAYYVTAHTMFFSWRTRFASDELSPHRSLNKKIGNFFLP